MCGRYGINVTEKVLFERYQLINDYGFKFENKNEIFPASSNPVLLPNQKFHYLKWGFLPGFSKKPLINARLESVMTKKTFQGPFAQKRCLVPATHFYEWQKINSEDKKHKKLIRVEGNPVFSMAGICERYLSDDGHSILTYAILTTQANRQMAGIHDRMPVILKRENEQLYLDLAADLPKLHQLLLSSDSNLIIENVD